jgi:hypothetical protein
MASSYVVQPLFPSNSDPTVYAINFDPSQAAVAQLRPLQRVPKGSILLQYESLNPTTCVTTAACAMYQKCSDTNCDTAVVVNQIATGSGVGSNVTGLTLAGTVVTLTQGAGGNQTVDLAAIAGTNTTTHTTGANVSATAATWTTVGTITNKLVDWWISNTSDETITHQVESRISGTNIQVRTNVTTNVRLHTLTIN